MRLLMTVMHKMCVYEWYVHWMVFNWCDMVNFGWFFIRQPRWLLMWHSVITLVNIWYLFYIGWLILSELFVSRELLHSCANWYRSIVSFRTTPFSSSIPGRPYHYIACLLSSVCNLDSSSSSLFEKQAHENWRGNF